MKKPVEGEPRGIAGSQTVDRALALVQLVAAQSGHGARLSELAVASGLDRATTYRLLVSLTNRGFLDQDSATKRYRLGLEFFALAATASNQIDLGAVARSVLQVLAAESGDTANVLRPVRAEPVLRRRQVWRLSREGRSDGYRVAPAARGGQREPGHLVRHAGLRGGDRAQAQRGALGRSPPTRTPKQSASPSRIAARAAMQSGPRTGGPDHRHVGRDHQPHWAASWRLVPGGHPGAPAARADTGARAHTQGGGRDVDGHNAANPIGRATQCPVDECREDDERQTEGACRIAACSCKCPDAEVRSELPANAANF